MSKLNQVAWTFNNTLYQSLKTFNKDIAQYQIDIMKEKACWKPEEIIIDCPKVIIMYMAWLQGPTDLLLNEELNEEDDFWEDEDNNEDGYFLADVLAHLSADNGINFTADELMMKIHNQMVNKELGDHVFFEGMDEFESEDGVLTFEVYCGS